MERKELAMPIDFCSKDELLKFMSDEEALKKSLKEADEGKLIPLRKVKTKTEGTLKMPRGYMKKLMGKMKVLDMRGKGFHKRNRRANRKVSRATTATRLWQIFVRRVKNG